MWVRRMNNAISHYPFATVAAYFALSFLVPVDLGLVMGATGVSLPTDVTLAYGLSLVLRTPRFLLDAALAPVLAAAFPRLRDVHVTRAAFSIIHQPLPEDRPGGRAAFATTRFGRVAALAEKYGLATLVSVRCVSPLLLTGGLLAALRSLPLEEVKAKVVEWCPEGIHNTAIYRHLIDANTVQTPSGSTAADAARSAISLPEFYGDVGENVMAAAEELSAVLAGTPSSVAAAGILAYALYPVTLYASCILGTFAGRWHAGLPVVGMPISDTSRPPAHEEGPLVEPKGSNLRAAGAGAAPLDPAAALAGIGSGSKVRTSATDKKSAQQPAPAKGLEASSASSPWTADLARRRLEAVNDAREEQLHLTAAASASRNGQER